MIWRFALRRRGQKFARDRHRGRNRAGCPRTVVARGTPEKHEKAMETDAISKTRDELKDAKLTKHRMRLACPRQKAIHYGSGLIDPGHLARRHAHHTFARYFHQVAIPGLQSALCLWGVVRLAQCARGMSTDLGPTRHGTCGMHAGRDHWLRTGPLRLEPGRGRCVLAIQPTPCSMEAFFVSTAIVALAEMGDKTSCSRSCWPHAFLQTLAYRAGHFRSHAGQPRTGRGRGRLGDQLLGPQLLRWVLGASFIAMALWMLIPDKLDDDEGAAAMRRAGA